MSLSSKNKALQRLGSLLKFFPKKVQILLFSMCSREDFNPEYKESVFRSNQQELEILTSSKKLTDKLMNYVEGNDGPT